MRLDFVGGAKVAMNVARDGVAAPVALRFACLIAGGGLGCLTMSATGAPDGAPNLDAIDLTPTVRARAKHLLATFGM